jgi:hypothetical protein
MNTEVYKTSEKLPEKYQEVIFYRAKEDQYEYNTCYVSGYFDGKVFVDPATDGYDPSRTYFPSQVLFWHKVLDDLDVIELARGEQCK